jgi:multidrug efflux system membrane fusion protein
MRKVIVFGAACALAAGVWFVSHNVVSANRRAPLEDTSKKTPVQVAEVTRQDTPVVVDAIGTVQAFNSVLVRSRVDGQLEKVAFVEGQEVRQGDLLAQLDPRPARSQLQLATAQKAKDAAQLANTQRDLARFSDLSHRGAVPVQTLDATQAQADQLQAALDGDTAQIDNARLQLEFTTIRAPIDGRVGARLVDAGNMVHATDSGGLVSIVQIHPVSIGFSIPQDVLPAMQAQQGKAPLKVSASSRDTSQPLGIGELTLIDNQIDATSGTIRCKATFANAQDLLWPGQFVNVGVVLDTRRDALSVPSTAVQAGIEGPYVFVVTDKGTAELRHVEVASSRDGRSAISRGVAAGQRVVIQGQYKLESGMPVRIVEQAAQAPQ